MKYEWDMRQQEDHARRYWTAGGIEIQRLKIFFAFWKPTPSQQQDISRYILNLFGVARIWTFWEVQYCIFVQ